jgi:hypothetical protein
LHGGLVRSIWRWVAMLKQRLDEGFDMIDREEEDSPNSTED